MRHRTPVKYNVKLGVYLIQNITNRTNEANGQLFVC